ncbi:hypothetical protein [Streptomyces sp. NPDC046985]|uniref:hypothetical protein n=1 Tax=Streptomyces sp. NPDC046985 TaxID=3155377 RepID=UPI0033EB5F30
MRTIVSGRPPREQAGSIKTRNPTARGRRRSGAGQGLAGAPGGQAVDIAGRVPALAAVRLVPMDFRSDEQAAIWISCTQQA